MRAFYLIIPKNENTREVIRQSGWTGWYVRVIEEGEIHQGDELILQHRPYPEWTIRRFKTHYFLLLQVSQN